MTPAPKPPSPRSRILGTGRYLPARVVTNAELEAIVDTSDAWVAGRTGIRRRRVAADHEVTSDLATAAAREALDAAGVAPEELDLVVVATVSGDSPLPACAVHLQRKLGATAARAAAFDVAAACAGFLYGLTIADCFVASGRARRVLVVGVEMLSRLVNWADRTTCVLFGDGAGAAVIGPADGDGRGVLASRIFSDGSLAGSLFIPAGGTAEPLTPDGLARRRNKVHMIGQDVRKAAVRNLVDASLLVLREAGVSPGDVRWVVAHQASVRILAELSARLGFPLDRFILDIEDYANTSSASVPIALDEAVRDGRIRPGDVVLLCALGAGVSWGAAVVRM